MPSKTLRKILTTCHYKNELHLAQETLGTTSFTVVGAHDHEIALEQFEVLHDFSGAMNDLVMANTGAPLIVTCSRVQNSARAQRLQCFTHPAPSSL